MSIEPEPRHILPADHPIVAAALDALHHFSDDLDRSTACLLLGMWAHVRELSDREYRSVLAAFPLPADTPPGSWLRSFDEPDTHGYISGSMGIDPIPDGVDGYPINGRDGWIGGSMGSTP